MEDQGPYTFIVTSTNPMLAATAWTVEVVADYFNLTDSPIGDTLSFYRDNKAVASFRSWTHVTRKGEQTITAVEISAVES